MNYDQAAAHVAALTGDASTAVNFRAIHDTNKAVSAIPINGNLTNCWSSIVAYNQLGYGIFIVVNELDGNGYHAHNVRSIRAHMVDLDNPATFAQAFEAASNWNPAPSFAVNSSPGKAHVYWPSTPYIDLAGYTDIQRRLAAQFGGDPQIIDGPRVMRLSGTFHRKNPASPYLVSCFSLRGYGQRTSPQALRASLAHVVVNDGGMGMRQPLGASDLASPGLEWSSMALFELDPNELTRTEWITVLSAYKQSVWNHCSEQQAYDIFCRWCERYHSNDPAENAKQWNSIRDTEVGWKNLARRSPIVMAYMSFGDPRTRKPPIAFDSGMVPVATRSTPLTTAVAAAPPMPVADQPLFGEYITGPELPEYFKGCYFVERFGTILTPSKRMMNQTQFKGRYGGKLFFITDASAKTTDDAWKAATSSTLYQIPKVDHTRFLPSEAPFAMVIDDLGRRGINTYTPAKVVSYPGDVSPFLNHLARLLPHESDRTSYIEYLAHNARFPGHKIAWAPLIQSTEGAGKGVIKLIISHVMGASYVYFPKAQELSSSGAKFNAWMREMLFILVDEIKVDDRRDMIEVLKPMISEEQIEIEGKGANQEKEDNFANWAFFSNFKDAMPISRNARRFAIYYSPLQTVDDLIAAGMDEAYFDSLYSWIKTGGGKEIIAHYLLNYPIERGAISSRAPETTSKAEALEQSRGPLDQLLHELIEDQKSGFRGGWVSSVAFLKAARDAGLSRSTPSGIAKVLEAAGFRKIGRAVRAYIQEGAERSTLYHMDGTRPLGEFGNLQGYE